MVLGALVLVLFSPVPTLAAERRSTESNRLTYLDADDPFYVGKDFPKLTTPQWIGEEGVDAVVTFGIDDMRGNPQKYETFLRPLLERLKRIDGRAPVSIFCNAIAPEEGLVQQWLMEGLSIEVHTLAHPCPILAKGNFQAAFDTLHGGVDLLNRISGNSPVAFRTPCCDSINSPSPRLFAEIFNRSTSAGLFLQADSSVMNIFTPADPALPRELITDASGKEKFRKYLPFPSFVTTIENYPYPYVIGKRCWEFPVVVPSDWEAQNLHGTNNPVTVADWKAALDATVLKQGIFNFIFHPHGWIASTQMVEFVDYAVEKYGRRVKFLNYREAVERLNLNLLASEPLRDARGEDNGVRLLDLNNDGYLDVVIGNGHVRKTRIWQPSEKRWDETEFPTWLVFTSHDNRSLDAGVRFGVVRKDGNASMLVNASHKGAWHFDGARWVEDKSLLAGLVLDAQPIITAHEGRDLGVRFRDVDRDGRCEMLVASLKQSATFSWFEEEKSWRKSQFILPPGLSIVDLDARDAGLRFVDLNRDGFDDLLFSNEREWSVHLWINTPKPWLGVDRGWSFMVSGGKRGEPGEIPAIVRGGTNRNNGAWFHSNHLWVQNEDTAQMKDLVDRRSFVELVSGVEQPAKSPDEELKSFQVRPGFKVELVASEPLVIDPVAFEWGADGKLWVAEMRDYPLGIDGHGKAGGVIKFLEDTDGDGRYDKATVFMEGVNFPNGIMTWRKGVLVSAAPEIFYSEDTNGDGKADVRRTILKGFVEGNQQHRVNGFEYGLDGWVYAANGDSSGKIYNALALGPNAKPAAGDLVDIRGHDLRFNPDTGEFQLVAGQTQFGRRRDDWGNWFGNNNPTWLWHYNVPVEFITPYAPAEWKSTRRILANYDEPNRVFAVSQPQRRFNWPDAIRQVTAACSATPYRDDLFGADFATSIFISEPANNVIHREVLEPDGATFRSRRASDEQDREFLASTDNWFRPTMLKTGPDGALYIADMYRLVIEHPEYFPEELKTRPDLRAGDDKGRIWRVYPEDKPPRKVPRLDKLDATGLIAALESPSGWQRDTAQRLLTERAAESTREGRSTRQERLKPEHDEALLKLVTKSPAAKVRLQALASLGSLGRLRPFHVIAALNDNDPHVRATAVRAIESDRHFNDTPAMMRLGGEQESTQVFQALARMTNDPSPLVRVQLALALGRKGSLVTNVLSKLALQETHPQVQAAILNAAGTRLGSHASGVNPSAMLSGVLASPERTPWITRLLAHLARISAESDEDATAGEHALKALQPSETGGFEAWQLELAAGWLDGVETRHGSLIARPAGEESQSRHQIVTLFTHARLVAVNEGRPEAERVTAIRLLGRGVDARDADIQVLASLLKPIVPVACQSGALDGLKRLREPAVADAILATLPELSPKLRTSAMSALLSRDEWTASLLAAVERGALIAAEISPAQQQNLLTQRSDVIRKRAEKIFAVRQTNRQQIVRNYVQMRELIGDVTHGAALYRQNCATCHQLKGEGFSVGPDMGTVADKPIEALLVAILDPNQAIDAAYQSFMLSTRSGRELSGIVASDTTAGITIRAAGGVEESVPRSEIARLTSSKLSLMPEGFEAVLPPQDMADLIAFLRSR